VTFEPDATQEDVFENSGVKKLVDMAVEGFVFSVIIIVVVVKTCSASTKHWKKNSALYHEL